MTLRKIVVVCQGINLWLLGCLFGTSAPDWKLGFAIALFVMCVVTMVAVFRTTADEGR